MLCDRNPAITALVEMIKQIQSQAYNDMQKQISDWKGRILNYLFMGCLPSGVASARLYIGDVLRVPLIQMQKHFLEKELTFKCHSSTGKRLLKTADDCTDGRSERRKRTLKMQMKTREQQAISDDASKIGPINKMLSKLTQLKDINQQIVGHLVSILDTVGQYQQLFSLDPLPTEHIAFDLLQMLAYQMQQHLQWYCKDHNKKLQEKRARQNDLILNNATLTMNIIKKQKRLRSLAVAQEAPLTIMQQLEYIRSHVGSVLNSQLKPLMEIFQYHVARRDSTGLRFINCSQWELTKYSSNELVRTSTAQRWKWLTDQDVNSMLSVEADLTAQWGEMITKKCLVVQVYSTADISLTFDELVIDLHPEFDIPHERLSVDMPQCYLS